MLFDPAAPILHAILEVVRQQGDDPVDILLMLLIGIDGVFPTNLELGPLQKPGVQARVDAVFHRLGRLHRDTAKLAALMHHLQEQPVGIGHLDTRRVHLGMHQTRFRVYIEQRSVLRIRQAGHAAHDRDRAVGAHIAEHAGLGAQRGIARLAHDHDLLAIAVVHISVARRRPFDRGAGQIAEPAQAFELGVMAILGPHRHRVERQASVIE